MSKTPSQYLTLHAAAIIQAALGYKSVSTIPFREAIDSGKHPLPELLWAYLQSGSDTPAVISLLRAWAAANMPALLDHLKD